MAPIGAGWGNGMRRLLVMITTLVLLLALPGPAGASGPKGGHPRDRTPDDQPLPGYTVTNPPLAPLTVGGAATRVFQGVQGHAAYTVEAPPAWNGQLVLYAHGFRGQGTELTVDPPPFGLREKLIGEGYAWAASSYTDNGYDVAAGVRSTRSLAAFAGSLIGRPSRLFLVGVSMGGHVTARSIEEYPGLYSAALPMCGVLGDDQLFDVFLDQNLVAQTLAGVPNYPPTADYLTTDVPVIEARLGLTGIVPGGSPTNDAGLQYRSIVINRTGGDRPGAANAFSYWYSLHFPFTLWQPDDGTTLARNPLRVATNVGTVYRPDSPVAVNATVPRIRPIDPASRRTTSLIASPRILGRPTVPVLSLHTIGDLFVPFSMEQIYARRVAAQGRSRLVVQRAIRADGHCEFSPAEAGRAWDDLVTWQATGARPAGDRVTDPAAVADPNFGCAFTDPTAYPTGTRPLLAPCPVPTSG